MAKVTVMWKTVTQHEAVFEIGDETWTGSKEQMDEVEKMAFEDAPSGTAVHSWSEVTEVEALRDGAEVPADIKAPAYIPDF